MTEWKQIPSYPDYEASSDGEIRRVVPDYLNRPLRVLRQHQAPSGYMRVSLTRNRTEERTCSVHVLVCETFQGPCPPDKEEVGHGNGKNHDNRADNLRWVTKIENAADRALHGTNQTGSNHWSHHRPDRIVRGEANKGGGGKLSDAAVREIRASSSLLKEASECYGVSMSLISQIRRGKAWTHVI